MRCGAMLSTALISTGNIPGMRSTKGLRTTGRTSRFLMRLLKDSLQAYGAATGSSPLLTAAFPASASQAAYIDWGTIVTILDQFNIMTYDFHGAWDPLCNHNSPLYPSAGADSAQMRGCRLHTVHIALSAIPASKINLGLPFYGQNIYPVHGTQQHHTGPDTTHFSAGRAPPMQTSSNK